MVRLKQVSNNSRHPTDRHPPKPTHPDPSISCGKRERQVLLYLNSLSGRFNIKASFGKLGIPKSSVYEVLYRLKSKGLINSELGNHKINERGKIYLKTHNMVSEGVSESSVGGVGNSPKCNLSTHYHKFRFIISDRTKFRIESLNRLNPKNVKENKLLNLHQVIATFEDATLVINPKQVILNLFDIITKDVSDSEISCLNRALEYEKKIRTVGLITHGIMLEEGHWARIESNLSDFLYNKVDKRYFLELDNGSKFWIDKSTGVLEDETDSKLVRERVDRFLNQIATNDINLEDLNSIKESLGLITKLEIVRLQHEIEKNKMSQTLTSNPNDSTKLHNSSSELFCYIN